MRFKLQCICKAVSTIRSVRTALTSQSCTSRVCRRETTDTCTLDSATLSTSDHAITKGRKRRRGSALSSGCSWSHLAVGPPAWSLPSASMTRNELLVSECRPSSPSPTSTAAHAPPLTRTRRGQFKNRLQTKLSTDEIECSSWRGGSGSPVARRLSLSQTPKAHSSERSALRGLRPHPRTPPPTPRWSLRLPLIRGTPPVCSVLLRVLHWRGPAPPCRGCCCAPSMCSRLRLPARSFTHTHIAQPASDGCTPGVERGRLSVGGVHTRDR
jgi:hypothetical protein